MADLFEDIEKGLKKVADFLHIEEVKEEGEVHHSSPYNVPRGEIGQVMVGSREYSPQEKTYNDLLYLAKAQSPRMIQHGVGYVTGVGYV